MRPILTGFLDLENKASFQEQIDSALKHHISTICLRSYNQNPLIEISDSDIKKILQILKESKIKIIALDTKIKSYDINDDHKHIEALDEFKYMIKLADRLKVQNLYLNLPKFNDVIEEYENIEKRLSPFIEAAMKSNKKIILLPVNNYKINVYAYLIKKIKSNIISVLFDPVSIMMNNESTTTAYRLLKKKIGAFAAIDANHQNVPQLIGYGKTDVLALFKKLIRDRYDGLLLIDNRFNDQVFNLELKKAGLFSKLFKVREKQKKSMISDLSKKIFPNEETKNVTYDDILDNQIKVLRIIFK
ncbi:MAG: TIM barrel protein [Acholeplasmataceae bacterium]|nr:TIM barrel protein [Acholeplasmataceae bacterium]